MSAGVKLDTTTLPPIVAEQFPEFPSGVTKEGVHKLLNSVDKSIVRYTGSYTPAMEHGIRRLREIRSNVEENSDSQVILRFCTESLAFELTNNLHNVQVRK